MADVDKILDTLEARRAIYEAKELQAQRCWLNGRDLPLNYDREDLFRHGREAMEWAINEACQALGRPMPYPDS